MAHDRALKPIRRDGYEWSLAGDQRPASETGRFMLVFIDESGDAGFKLDRGSSPVFVAAMVIFADDAAAATMQDAIAQSEARRIHKGEFKFSKARDDVRDLFFKAIDNCPFTVRAIVVKKDAIRSVHLKSDKDTFYAFFVKQMIRRDSDRLSDARVIIDGSGDRAFKRDLSAALRKLTSPTVIKSFKFSDSRNDPLVQLADMCVGAIARSYREDRPDRNRWRNMLTSHIEDIWDF